MRLVTPEESHCVTCRQLIRGAKTYVFQLQDIGAQLGDSELLHLISLARNALEAADRRLMARLERLDPGA